MSNRCGGGIRFAVLAVALALTWASAAPARAQNEAASTNEIPSFAPQGTTAFVSPLKPDGGTQWNVFYGFGVNQQIIATADDIHVASAGVRWSHMWSPRLGSFLRGHPAVALEAVPITTFVQEGKTTLAGGANLLYEHHFAVQSKVLPVLKLGAGLLYADRELPRRGTKFNFSLIAALGFDFVVTESSALFVGYRFHHVSNASTGKINPGFNVHTLIFGLSFYR